MRYLLSHLREADYSSILDHVQVALGPNLQNSASTAREYGLREHRFKRLLKTDPLTATKSMIRFAQSTVQKGVG